MTDAREAPDQLDAWIDEHWDPELTVGAWWDRMASAGRSVPSDRWRERGVLGPPAGPAVSIVLPVLVEHAAPDLRDELVASIRSGRHAWCLLFSEPGAGTDLAALTTTATRDGDGWRLDGRKTWATGAHVADMAIVLARTGEHDTRHRGLTCFALAMVDAPGVEVRPMREMTGNALSNDVTLDGVWVPGDHVIGPVGEGWSVVNVALTAERRSVGVHRGSAASAGSRSGDLDRTAAEVLARPRRTRTQAPAPDAIARRVAVPAVRQELATLHVAAEVARLNAARAAAVPFDGAANVAKLQAGDVARRSAAVAGRALGARALLHGYGEDQPVDDAAAATAMILAAPAVSLVGGVDLVQRDLLGERVLGLPRPERPGSIAGDRSATG